MKVEIFSRLTIFGRRHFFRVRAGNGKTLLQSEGYSRRIDAIGTIHSLKNGLANAEIIDA